MKYPRIFRFNLKQAVIKSNYDIRNLIEAKKKMWRTL